MNSYKALRNQAIHSGPYALVPIRFEDRYSIMNWRNEQIYHLRQAEPLTKKKQDDYFENVINQLFDQKNPDQLLFSFLDEEQCVGYGGLVHINWNDKNAEISFVMDTSLQEKHFETYWTAFLKMLEKIAFDQLDLHKIYTFAYDVRPRLYTALNAAGFKKEARLSDHVLIDGTYKDAIYHTKYNLLHDVVLRKITSEDVQILFEWVNDKEVRENSIQQDKITWEQHKSWFENKMKNAGSEMFIGLYKGEPFGQLRLDLIEEWWEIDFSLSKRHRRKGLGKSLVKKALLDLGKSKKLKAYVRPNNIPSKRVFETLGFKKCKMVVKSGAELIEYQYIYS